MTRGYIAVAVPPSGFGQQLDEAVERGKAAGLSLFLRTESLAVLGCMVGNVQLLSGDRGIVIGDVFRRKVPTRAFDGREEAIAEVTNILIDGKATEDLWGDFVAIYSNARNEVQFIHSPCGAINLYHLEWDGALLLASDAALLLTVSRRRRSLNWAAISHNLYWDDVSTADTCINGVGEVRCGETGSWSDGRVNIQTVWNPWHFTGEDISIFSADEAVDVVRREIFRCVSARLSTSGRYSLDLSGGLDSSIIAAVCAARGADVTAINLFNPATEGDERFFAKSVASHLGIELIEAPPAVEDIEIAHCARPHLPRPYVRAFVQALDKASSEAASTFCASAFLNGGGGDAVFCHLQSSGPVVDALRSIGRAPNAVRISYEVARAAQCNVWDVALKSFLKLVRGGRHRRNHPNQEYLTSRCEALARSVAVPWAPLDGKPLPGKFEQVHGIYSSLYNLNGFARSDHSQGIFPLLSQPLVEACLRVPTWLWLGEGRNRLIARRAMEQMLPPQVVWRKSKGGLSQLQRDTIRRKRETIRDRILQGQLAGQGLIDRQAIERELASDQSYSVEKISCVMRLCDFEAWCAAS